LQGIQPFTKLAKYANALVFYTFQYFISQPVTALLPSQCDPSFHY